MVVPLVNGIVAAGSGHARGGGYLIRNASLVLTASGFMTGVELFADKIPWVDSLWDAVHTFLRVPGGALLAAAAMGDSGAGAVLAAAIIGGTITAGTHLAKAGARAVVNTSPETCSCRPVCGRRWLRQRSSS